MSPPHELSRHDSRARDRKFIPENGRSAPHSKRLSLSGIMPGMDLGQPHPPSPQRLCSSDSPTSTSRRSTTSTRSQSVMGLEESWILVMGMTGSGKSTFINLLAEEKDRVRVGHSLNSTTAEVQDHVYQMAESRIVRLLDTPGFDDTNRSDTDVLQTIANAMNGLYKLGRRIDGVIYLHPIIDPRMNGAALKSLGILRRICGDEYFPHIALVSTRWESLKGEGARRAAEDREADLIEKPEFWGELVDQGSMPLQHDGSVRSARKIVDKLVGRTRQAPLKLQLEMRDGKTLAETKAGSFVEGEVLKMKENYEKDVERLMRELNQIKAEGDLREEESVLEQTKAVQAKISHLQQDAASLHVDSRQLDDLKGSQRRKSFPACDWRESLSDDEPVKMSKRLKELRKEMNYLANNIDDLREENADLLRNNKYLEQEHQSHRRRLFAANRPPCVERRWLSPSEFQLSVRRSRGGKGVNEVTKNIDREHRTSEHDMFGGHASSVPSPRWRHNNHPVDSDSPERQAQSPPRGIHRSHTVPIGSTLER